MPISIHSKVASCLYRFHIYPTISNSTPENSHFQPHSRHPLTRKLRLMKFQSFSCSYQRMCTFPLLLPKHIFTSALFHLNSTNALERLYRNPPEIAPNKAAKSFFVVKCFWCDQIDFKSLLWVPLQCGPHEWFMREMFFFFEKCQKCLWILFIRLHRNVFLSPFDCSAEKGAKIHK